MDARQEIKEIVKKSFLNNKLAGKGLKILLGLSGGPDSVALAHILKELSLELNFALSAAHLNHGWRENAYLDVELCQNLCNKLEIPFSHAHADEFKDKIKKTNSKEEAGRLLRRAFFEELKKKEGFDLIALAHHAQDQLETFFIRLARGASLSGLCAMQELKNNYFRPMLSCPKNLILEFINKEKIKVIIDPTNEDQSFLRNRIRSQLIPILNLIDPRLDRKILETINNLKAENSALDSFSQAQIENNPKLGPTILLNQFRKLEKSVQMRVLINFFVSAKISFTPSQALLNEALKFILSNRGGKHQLGIKWSLKKAKNQLWIESIDSKICEN